MLRIYPTNKLPHLSRIAEVDVPHPPKTSLSFCSLSRNKVIYLIESSLNVWDYLGDAWTCIRVPGGYQKVRFPADDRAMIFLNILTGNRFRVGHIAPISRPSFSMENVGPIQEYKSNPAVWLRSVRYTPGVYPEDSKQLSDG